MGRSLSLHMKDSLELIAPLNVRHVSTPFVYSPRSRPGVPLPAPMRQSFDTFKFIETPEWQRWESVMKARVAGGKDILCQVCAYRPHRAAP